MARRFFPATIVSAEPSHVFCDLAGEAVILDLREGIYYGLNRVGARVWQLLQQPTTVEKLVGRISAEYDASPYQVEEDISWLLIALSSHRLIEVRHASVGQEVSSPSKN
jgi:hypothetical protein